MKSRVIQQAVVGSILGVLLVLASITGTRPSQIGLMLVAFPSHLA